MKKLLLLLIIPFLGFGQTPITNNNIYEAVNEWIDDPVLAESLYGHISTWDVSNVTSMNSLFADKYNFNDDISNWDVSNVTDMDFMFGNNYIFNQDISNWDVSSVIDMMMMFNNCYVFNQDIGNWDVGNVTNMRWMFFKAIDFNQDIGNWDVSSVENMYGTFALTETFNQDISDWDMSSVNTIEGMFLANPVFNQDISNWNVSNIQSMRTVFNGAESFNQNISDWDVSNVVIMEGMFNASGLSTSNYDALLIGWSNLNLQSNVLFGSFTSYCDGEAARQYIIDTFNWTINDGGYNCNNGTHLYESLKQTNLITTLDILGKATTNKGFQLHIYDDGSVEKKYLIK